MDKLIKLAAGWEEWAPKKGKLMTGPGLAIAAVQLRSGAEVSAPFGFGRPAWTHVGSSADVVAYLPRGAS